jgi:hypothetical protein
MQSHRDPSVLRSLALSFGEGLAFSVGMKLTQSAIRPGNAPVEAPDFGPIAARLEQIEQRVSKAERPREPQALDQKVIGAIVSALESRLQENSGQVERRLSDLQSTLAASVQNTVASRVEQEAAALRDEVRAMHREFAANVAQVVGEQVALRTAEIEPAVRERVAAAIAPLHAELTELRARMAETENTMAEFVSAISMMCRQAADRNKEERAAAAVPPAVEAPPALAAVPAEPAAAAASAASASAEPALDLPVPGFAQTRKPPGTWRIPVASSFLFAFTAVGVLMRVF